MREQQVTIKDEFGMHLRSIMVLVEAARKFESRIQIRFGDEVADGKSPWALLGLGVIAGSQITISAEGRDEEEAVRTLSLLAEQNFVPDSEVKPRG